MIKRGLRIGNLLPYPNPALLFYFLLIFNNFLLLYFKSSFSCTLLELSFIILSCISFLSILPYALPIDGIGFLCNFDSYVIVDIGFAYQGVKNLDLIIFGVSSYTQIVAM